MTEKEMEGSPIANRSGIIEIPNLQNVVVDAMDAVN